MISEADPTQGAPLLQDRFSLDLLKPALENGEVGAGVQKHAIRSWRPAKRGRAQHTPQRHPKLAAQPKPLFLVFCSYFFDLESTRSGKRRGRGMQKQYHAPLHPTEPQRQLAFEAA